MQKTPCSNLYRGAWQNVKDKETCKRWKVKTPKKSCNRCIYFPNEVHGYKDSWLDFYGTLVMTSTENAI